MSTPDFSTAENNQELANEVTCLKKQIALIEDQSQAAVFSNTVKQIKQAYRQ